MKHRPMICTDPGSPEAVTPGTGEVPGESGVGLAPEVRPIVEGVAA
ncbi:hypothetical protein [Nonomuraea zeae]|nr:hypothetical protein [Nonomuraea zeae]